MANTILLWKGAVEPAETSPAGNEMKMWKGAVEPVGAAVTPPGVSDGKKTGPALTFGSMGKMGAS